MEMLILLAGLFVCNSLVNEGYYVEIWDYS